MDLPWQRSQVAVRKTAKLIEAVATKALSQLIREVQSSELVVSAAGIVGAPERRLEKIGSAHIRAHAAEGVLFRQVLEAAAEKNGLVKRTLDERKLNEIAATELGFSAATLEGRLTDLGRAVGRPWRADEKAAAAAREAEHAGAGAGG